MMIFIGNIQMVVVQRQIIVTLCLLFCIHHSVRVQAQSFVQIKNMAESGNVEAQFYLGNLYENGKGCEKDIHKAIYWYEKSLANGNKHVAPHLGIAYHSIKEYSKAYSPLAVRYYNLGNATSCEKWAKRAIEAGVQTEDAKILLKKIE